MVISDQHVTYLDTSGDYVMGSPTPMQRRFRDLPDEEHCRTHRPLNTSESVSTPLALHNPLQVGVHQNLGLHSYSPQQYRMGAEPTQHPVEEYSYAAQASSSGIDTAVPSPYNPFGLRFDSDESVAMGGHYPGSCHGMPDSKSKAVNRTMGPRKRAHSESDSDGN